MVFEHRSWNTKQGRRRGYPGVPNRPARAVVGPIDGSGATTEGSKTTDEGSAGFVGPASALFGPSFALVEGLKGTKEGLNTTVEGTDGAVEGTDATVDEVFVVAASSRALPASMLRQIPSPGWEAAWLALS